MRGVDLTENYAIVFHKQLLFLLTNKIMNETSIKLTVI